MRVTEFEYFAAMGFLLLGLLIVATLVVCTPRPQQAVTDRCYQVTRQNDVVWYHLVKCPE